MWKSKKHERDREVPWVWKNPHSDRIFCWVLLSGNERNWLTRESHRLFATGESEVNSKTGEFSASYNGRIIQTLEGFILVCVKNSFWGKIWITCLIFRPHEYDNRMSIQRNNLRESSCLILELCWRLISTSFIRFLIASNFQFHSKRHC